MGIYARGKFWWMHIGRAGQKPIRRSTGIPTGGRSAVQIRQHEEDAQDIYNCAIADLARGRFDLPTRQPPSLPFDKAVAMFVGELPKELRMNRRYKFSPLVRHWKGRPVATITLQDLYTYRKTRLDAGITVGTVTCELATLRPFFKYLVSVGHLKATPFTGYIGLSRAEPPARRLLTHDEEARLLAELSPEERAIFLVGQDSLVRLSNILSLEWADDHGRFLRILKSKNRKAYDVPVSSRTRAALDALPRGGHSMFPFHTRGKNLPCWKMSFYRSLKAAAERAGIPWGRAHGRTFHWSTRRTGASRMLQRNAPLKSVQKIGNWLSLNVLMEIYNEAAEATAWDIVELVGAPERQLKLVHSQTRDKHTDAGNLKSIEEKAQ